MRRRTTFRSGTEEQAVAVDWNRVEEERRKRANDDMSARKREWRESLRSEGGINEEASTARKRYRGEVRNRKGGVGEGQLEGTHHSPGACGSAERDERGRMEAVTSRKRLRFKAPLEES